jgi:hypothetical protein
VYRTLFAVCPKRDFWAGDSDALYVKRFAGRCLEDRVFSATATRMKHDAKISSEEGFDFQVDMYAFRFVMYMVLTGLEPGR